MRMFLVFSVSSLLSTAALAQQECPTVGGSYRILGSCQVEDEQLQHATVIAVEQSGCDVTLSATVEKLVQPPPRIPSPYPGPYDMCAMFAFNCSLYGEGCEAANSPECQAYLNQEWDAPVRVVKEVTARGDFSDVKLDLSNRLSSVLGCQIHSRVR